MGFRCDVFNLAQGGGSHSKDSVHVGFGYAVENPSKEGGSELKRLRAVATATQLAAE